MAQQRDNVNIYECDLKLIAGCVVLIAPFHSVPTYTSGQNCAAHSVVPLISLTDNN